MNGEKNFLGLFEFSMQPPGYKNDKKHTKK